MKRVKVISILLIFLLRWFAPVLAASIGENSGDSLNIDVGARSVAMGGTQFGSEEDAFAPFYNPAFLANLSQKEVGVMHNEFINDLTQDVVSFVRPLSGKGTLSAQVSYWGIKDIKGYDASGARSGDVAASDLNAGFSWARGWKLGSTNATRPNSSIALGATGKILRSTLDNASASGIAADFGVYYRHSGAKLNGLRLAAAMQNLGPKLQYDKEQNSLPLSARVGAAYSFLADMATVTGDLVYHYPNKVAFHTGLEYKIAQLVSLRVGYKKDKDAVSPYSFGLGFGNEKINVSYAIAPFGNLGAAHRIGLNIKFGRRFADKDLTQSLVEQLTQVERLIMEGDLIKALMLSLQIQQDAPWLKENNKILTKLQKEISVLAAEQKRTEFQIKINEMLIEGQQFMAEGNLIDAQIRFQTVIELDPKNEPAKNSLRQIDAQVKSVARAFYDKGIIAFSAGNLITAKEEFEKVITIQPDNDEATKKLNQINSELEKEKKTMIQSQIKDRVNNKFEQGMKAIEAHNFENAITYFLETLSLDPKNQEAKEHLNTVRSILFEKHYAHCLNFVNTSNWEQAIKMAKRALEYNPDSESAKRTLNNVERNWKVQKSVQSQQLYKNGLTAYLSGDKFNAKELWVKALNLDNENIEVKRALARMEGN